MMPSPEARRELRRMRSREVPRIPFPRRWVHVKWREALTARLDVTLARAEGSLAVSQGLVVAVYGLNLVEAPPAIYEIHAVLVARVDTVVARAGADLVVTCAGEDFVVPFATLELIVAAATLEAVVPIGPPQSVGTPSASLVDRQSHPA